MTTQQIVITIAAGADGGVAIYESLDDTSVFAFAGNADEATAYLSGRIQKITVGPDRPAATEHQRIFGKPKDAPRPGPFRRPLVGEPGGPTLTARDLVDSLVDDDEALAEIDNRNRAKTFP